MILTNDKKKKATSIRFFNEKKIVFVQTFRKHQEKF